MNAKELRALLDSEELSQSEAARRLDIDPRTMRRYIAGDLEIPLLVEIAIKAVTSSWTDTLKLREVNARLRQIGEFGEKELRKISDGVVNPGGIAKAALRKIREMRARYF
jgi:hypothetical protein